MKPTYLETPGLQSCEWMGYVDDERVTRSTSDLTWTGCSKFAKLRAHLGLQDATRMHREPSQEPGPWARVIMHSWPDEAVSKLVTQMHWDWTKRFLWAGHQNPL